MLSSHPTAPSPLTRLVLALTLTLSIVSCRTSRSVPVQVVEHTKHDTCYVAKVEYDSVYISSNRFIDRGRDTLYIEDKVVEYRYKLLRDTLRIHEVDSIPVIRTVEVTHEVSYVPPWVKVLAWIGGIGTLVLLFYFGLKLAKIYLTYRL